MPGILARELSKRGHSLRVLTGFPNYPEGRIYGGYRMAPRRDEVDAGVALRRVALYPSHSRSIVGRAASYSSFAMSASLWGPAWFKDVDALWVANSPPTVGLPTWLIKAVHRPRIVLHILDLWPESLVSSGFGGSIRRGGLLDRALERWLSFTYRTADSIACISHRQIELLAQRGVARNKLSYVPIWVDEHVFRPMDRDERLASKLGVAGKRVLLYAGAIGETQGLDTLIDACARMRDEPRFHCLIAGTGVAEDRLREKVRDAGLSNVSFLGRWPTNEMTPLMSIGDVHYVSLRSDSIAYVAVPSKLPASLACGKPVIIAARGDAAELIKRSGAGWVCAPGDAGELDVALRAMAHADAQTLDAMGGFARDTFEHEFAIDIGVERVEGLLMNRAA